MTERRIGQSPKKEALTKAFHIIDRTDDRLTPNEQDLLRRSALGEYVIGEISEMIDEHLGPERLTRILSPPEKKITPPIQVNRG